MDAISAVLQSHGPTTSRQINRRRGTPGAPPGQRRIHDQVVLAQGVDLAPVLRGIAANPAANPAAEEQDAEWLPEEGYPDA